jgi:hypothetical protein
LLIAPTIWPRVRVWPDDVVGSIVIVLDLNANGAMDIITSTNRVTFVFWSESHSARTAAEKKFS